MALLLGGMVLGCFAVLPYAVLRRDSEPGSPGVPQWGWALLATGFLGFGGWGLVAGDVGGWLAMVRTDGFLWPMTWDFALFSGLFVAEARGRLLGRAG